MDLLGIPNLLLYLLGAGGLVAALAARPFARTLSALSRNHADSLTDPLTGLGNRRKLMEDLDDALAVASEQQPYVMVLLDLDGFKRYNDAYGHPAGDVLLARLGADLGASVSSWATAYRVGGDEFCVLVHDRGPGLETVVSAAATALSDRGEGFSVRTSCGMVALPHEAATPDAALHLADRRLYAEKAARPDSRPRDGARELLLTTLRERESARGDRLDRVPELARGVGRQLELSSDELDVIVRAAELHDLGKVALPDTILSKEGSLTEEELAYVREHTAVADRLLSAAPAMVPVARLVRASRERFDGSGYPDGLRGDDIPLGSRILAVCDAYHAMTSDRPYRAAMSQGEALEQLRLGAGDAFDPAVVTALGQVVDPGGPRARVSGANGLRALLTGAAVALVALLAPGSALAGTASIGGSQVTVTASVNDFNAIQISPSGANIRISESGFGAFLSAGAGCVPDLPNQVLCPAAGITSISVDAGNWNDWVTATVATPLTLLGGSGDDQLIGGSGSDTLDGGSGVDIMDGGAGADTFIGGTSDDYADYSARSAPVTVDLDGAADDGTAGENDNVGSDVEILVGGSAADTLTGNAAINGLDGGPGADDLNGGGGDDLVLYWNRSNAVTADLDGVADDGEPGENDDYADIEGLVGGAGNDVLTGGPGNDYFSGQGGGDVIDGGLGADVVEGGTGIDRVTYASRAAAVDVHIDNVAGDGEAGEGDNIGTDVENLTGGSGADSLWGTNGANQLEGGPGDDVLSGGLGADALGGGPGSDRVRYTSRPTPVTANLDGLAGDGEAGENDTIGADVEDLTGGSAADALTGNAEGNELSGGPGADTLSGGAGDDLLDGDLGADVLNGGAGADSATYAARTAPVEVDLDGSADDGEAGEGDDVGRDVENLVGGSAGDTLTGDAGSNTLDGGQGADVLSGGAGADSVTYAARTAPVAVDLDGSADDGEAGEGDNVGSDVETVVGGSAGDTLTGDAGSNTLTGGDGDDTLDGGNGRDALSGVNGNDTFLARDGEIDEVECGEGGDMVTGDSGDRVASDCDEVDTGAVAKVVATVAAEARPQTVTLDRRGRVSIRVRCPRSSPAPCRGTVTLELPRRKRQGKARAASSAMSKKKKPKKPTKLGRGKFAVEPGTTGKVEVRLSHNGRRRVLRKRKVRCSASVVTVGADGKRTETRAPVTIKAPKATGGSR